MKKKKWLNILKWLWLVIVAAAAGWYFIGNFRDIRDNISSIRITRLLLSLLILLIAKLLTADLTYHSLKITTHPFSFIEAFSITSITQLGKYIPGGIWHFAGKFGIYKTRGISAKAAAIPIIIENLWLIASALITGLLSLLLSRSTLPCRYLPFPCTNLNKLISILVLVLLWVFAVYIALRVIFQTAISPWLHLRLSIQQLIIWCLFGCSFWLIFPKNPEIDFLLQAVSAFSLSWALGYVAFFAPGGIGIREAAMTLLLSAFFPPQTAAIYTAIHRLLWVVTEILLALFCMAFYGLPLGLQHTETSTEITEKT